MMRQHQFIHKNEQSKNRRRFILLLLLSFSFSDQKTGSNCTHKNVKKEHFFTTPIFGV